MRFLFLLIGILVVGLGEVSASNGIRLPNLAINKDGVICAAGTRASEVWVVTCSKDSGKTWTWVDEVTLRKARPSKIIAAPSGAFYVVGHFQPNYISSVVRVSYDNGDTWKTLTEKNESSKGIGWTLNDLVFTPLGDLFLFGYFWGNGLDPVYPRWTALQSSDAGLSWRLSDKKLNSRFNTPESAAVDGQGTLYAAGYNSTGGMTYPPTDEPKFWQWIIRKSEDNGGSWRTVLEGYRHDMASKASAITVGPNGAIYVAGLEGEKLVVRKSSDQGQSWTVIDRYHYPQARPEWYSKMNLLFDQSGRLHLMTGFGSPQGPFLLLRSTSDEVNWRNVEFADWQWGSTLVSFKNSLYMASQTQDGHAEIRHSKDGGETWTILHRL